MSNFLNYANSKTPIVSDEWSSLDIPSRKEIVHKTISNAKQEEFLNFEILECKNDGQVIVKIVNPMHPSQRGMWLLRLELILKKEIDEGITVWAESLGDKNSLRNLRGIKVKS